MRRFILPCAVIAGWNAVACLSFGAPLLPVTKLPGAPAAYSGPAGDPNASLGQWFVDPALSNTLTARTHEFHDNVQSVPGGPIGGGGSLGSSAITGHIANLVYTGGNLTSFSILATISNDGLAGSTWNAGGNSLLETIEPRAQQGGTMLGTILTAEFRVANTNLLPPGGIGPYSDSGAPYIVATNETKRAWYGWSPNRPIEAYPGEPGGSYYVPAWDFGDIPIGGSVTRPLTFTITGAGLADTDPRFTAIVSAQSSGADVFYNRSSSLKIGDWLGDLSADEGTPYPGASTGGFGSNASVFANVAPEPGTLILAVAGLLAIRRRSHRRASAAQ